MLGWITGIFRTPTPCELAATELAEAERSQLKYQTAHEYAKHMSDYQAARIERLKAFLKAEQS